MSNRISHDEAEEFLVHLDDAFLSHDGSSCKALVGKYISQQRALTDSLRAAGLLTEEGEVRNNNPRTLDGVPVFHGMSVYRKTRYSGVIERHVVFISARAVIEDRVDVDACGTYSTREAALAAQTRKDGGQ